MAPIPAIHCQFRQDLFKTEKTLRCTTKRRKSPYGPECPNESRLDWQCIARLTRFILRWDSQCISSETYTLAYLANYVKVNNFSAILAATLSYKLSESSRTNQNHTAVMIGTASL